MRTRTKQKGLWHQPDFWWQTSPSSVARILKPLGNITGLCTAIRSNRATPYQGAIPVICVGSFSVGGMGKTPVAQGLARFLIAQDVRPVFLTRGYGGDMVGPIRVDPMRHYAQHVGDEALLLAQTAPTVVARDRAIGAQYASALGADVVIVDDGLYSARLHYDLRLAVVDGRFGIGNGYVIPAGPLRAPLRAYASRVHGIFCIAPVTSAMGSLMAWAEAQHIPVIEATMTPSVHQAALLKGKQVLAFSGIGHPQKFFDTLASCGALCSELYAYGDHHLFSKKDLLFLAERCVQGHLIPVTTEKDAVRLKCFDESQPFSLEQQKITEFLKRLQVLPIAIQWGSVPEIKALLGPLYGKSPS
jgi:tetraacyldisaccharide 4'-kinase